MERAMMWTYITIALCIKVMYHVVAAIMITAWQLIKQLNRED